MTLNIELFNILWVTNFSMSQRGEFLLALHDCSYKMKDILFTSYDPSFCYQCGADFPLLVASFSHGLLSFRDQAYVFLHDAWLLGG